MAAVRLHNKETVIFGSRFEKRHERKRELHLKVTGFLQIMVTGPQTFTRRLSWLGYWDSNLQGGNSRTMLARPGGYPYWELYLEHSQETSYLTNKKPKLNTNWQETGPITEWQLRTPPLSKLKQIPHLSPQWTWRSGGLRWPLNTVRKKWR